MQKKKNSRRSKRLGAVMALVSTSTCIIVTGAGLSSMPSDTAPEFSPRALYTTEVRVSYTLCYEDAVRLAQTLYGEARGVSTIEEKAAVVWCILNRVDDPRWPDTISEVCTNSQFHGYDPQNPIDDSLYDLVQDVYSRWVREHAGAVDVGRVLPKEYVFFHGDGSANYFRTEYRGSSGYWDWSLPSPYSTERG